MCWDPATGGPGATGGRVSRSLRVELIGLAGRAGDVTDQRSAVRSASRRTRQCGAGARLGMCQSVCQPGRRHGDGVCGDGSLQPANRVGGRFVSPPAMATVCFVEFL